MHRASSSSNTRSGLSNDRLDEPDCRRSPWFSSRLPLLETVDLLPIVAARAAATSMERGGRSGLSNDRFDEQDCRRRPRFSSRLPLLETVDLLLIVAARAATTSMERGGGRDAVPKLGDLSFLELGMVSSSLLGLLCCTACSYFEKVCAGGGGVRRGESYY
jgi:hypothetical protein